MSIILISCPQAVTMFVVRTSVRIMRTEVRTTNRFYCDRPIALASPHKPGFWFKRAIANIEITESEHTHQQTIFPATRTTGSLGNRGN
ncbi:MULTISPECIES: hypothetical protein [unclassified Microcoleus]|uniref:hypothetical protein n=1 Tax=unclassified Microcoleus TaxID=2642155 RepID=UPI0025F4E583|nr:MULTISPECIES: hypothetical protein [unclassified Microcoleus]